MLRTPETCLDSGSATLNIDVFAFLSVTRLLLYIPLLSKSRPLLPKPVVSCAKDSTSFTDFSTFASSSYYGAVTMFIKNTFGISAS